jgi:hypothetical protein
MLYKFLWELTIPGLFYHGQKKYSFSPISFNAFNSLMKSKVKYKKEELKCYEQA